MLATGPNHRSIVLLLVPLFYVLSCIGLCKGGLSRVGPWAQGSRRAPPYITHDLKSDRETEVLRMKQSGLINVGERLPLYGPTCHH